MLILRIKRCESALAGGRLDEALELLSSSGLRKHRRGQELTDQLTTALVERSRGHLAAGRLGPADEDCRKASQLAGHTNPIAQRRAAIDRANHDTREHLVQREQATAAARRLVEQGQFTLGHQLAARVPDGDVLLTDIADRRSMLDRCIADASAAIGREDWESAVQCVAKAQSLCPGAGEAHNLSKTIGDRVSRKAQDLLESGRLDAASMLLRRVTPMQNSHSELMQIQHGLDQCRVAWDCITGGRLREATEVLGRLAIVWPDADWIRATLEGISRADDAMGDVRTGPLGLLNLGETMAMPIKRPSLAAPAPTPLPHRAINRRFLLHVDGAGSYLVILGNSISLGPVSITAPPDLPLMTSANAPVVVLSRSDEDYFLNSRSPVQVNDRTLSSKLMAGGDRISMGPRCRIEFTRPNPASGSAVLRITGTRLPWGGVREVLLMDRELVIGSFAAAHIKTRDTLDQVVLQVSDGRLLCRATGAILIDDKPAGKLAELTSGARIVAGGLSLVVQSV